MFQTLYRDESEWRKVNEAGTHSTLRALNAAMTGGK